MPRSISDVIARCLKRNPLERYDACELLRAARQLEAAVSKPGLSTEVNDAVTEYVETKDGGSKGLPLLVGAAAASAVLVLAVVALYFAFSGGPSADTAGANTEAAKAGANLKKGLDSAPTPAASADAAQREVEITTYGGQADIYRGAEKIGRTPYTYKGRLGDHVVLTLKREGFKDETVDFVVGEKKAYMYDLKK